VPTPLQCPATRSESLRLLMGKVFLLRTAVTVCPAKSFHPLSCYVSRQLTIADVCTNKGCVQVNNERRYCIDRKITLRLAKRSVHPLILLSLDKCVYTTCMSQRLHDEENDHYIEYCQTRKLHPGVSSAWPVD
jgi:hypothetical protein